MALRIQKLGARRFADDKLQKLTLFETPRFFCDVYCLEPNQAQKAHRHQDGDKVYVVLEGQARVTVGGDSADVGAGDAVLCPAGVEHALENPGPQRVAVLVFMAPHPRAAELAP